MNTQAIIDNPPRLSGAHVTDDSLTYLLEDGRTISVPIDYYPTLALASRQERQNFEVFPVSVHWPDLDADIGVEGLLLGAKENPHYAALAVQRAEKLERLPKIKSHESKAA